MARQIDISWCYSDHSGDEYWFYDSIPGAQHKCWTSDGGPFSRGSDALHYLIYSGAAVLSSKVLAAAIRAYLTSRKDKVRITVSGANKMEVRYEGPSFSDEESAIEGTVLFGGAAPLTLFSAVLLPWSPAHSGFVSFDFLPR
jgi:hypothetical protein